MPPLESLPPIRSPLAGSPGSPHPGPSEMPLRLERLSPREQVSLGHRFGIDTPYYAVPLGWGEWTPAYGGPLDSPEVREIAPPLAAIHGPRALVPHDGLFPHDGLYPTDSGYTGP